MKRGFVGLSLAAAFVAGSLAFRPTPLEAQAVEGVAVFGVYTEFLADGGCSVKANHSKPGDEEEPTRREHWLLSRGECDIEKGRAAQATALDYGIDAGVR